MPRTPSSPLSLTPRDLALLVSFARCVEVTQSQLQAACYPETREVCASCAVPRRRGRTKA